MRRDRQQARALEAMGFERGRKTKHGEWWTHPSGARVHAAGTPGDVRAMKNLRADARRALRAAA